MEYIMPLGSHAVLDISKKRDERCNSLPGTINLPTTTHSPRPYPRCTALRPERLAGHGEVGRRQAGAVLVSGGEGVVLRTPRNGRKRRGKIHAPNSRKQRYFQWRTGQAPKDDYLKQPCERQHHVLLWFRRSTRSSRTQACHPCWRPLRRVRPTSIAASRAQRKDRCSDQRIPWW